MPQRSLARLTIGRGAELWAHNFPKSISKNDALSAILAGYWQGHFDKSATLVGWPCARRRMLEILRKDTAHPGIAWVEQRQNAEEVEIQAGGKVNVDPRTRIFLPDGENAWTSRLLSRAYKALAMLSVDDYSDGALILFKRIELSRPALERFAASEGMRSLFLLGYKPFAKLLDAFQADPSPRNVEEGTKAIPAHRFVRQDVVRWYTKYVGKCMAAGEAPSREADLEAARRVFGYVQRDFMRDLRRDLAPPEWKYRGRRKTGKT